MKWSMIVLWTLWLFLNMVAEVSAMPSSPDPVASPGTPGSSGTTTAPSSMTLSKVFGYCTKLNKTNYDVWLAGLISAISGLTVLSAK